MLNILKKPIKFIKIKIKKYFIRKINYVKINKK